MTLEEKKKKLVQKLDILSEKELNYLLNFIEELSSKRNENYNTLASFVDENQEEEREEKIKSIIEKDFTRFKETFKALS